MPNIVYNKLKFTCHGETKADNVKEFLQAGEIPLSFAKLIPVPHGISDPDPRILSSDENKWCTENWGTKWDAMNPLITHKADWRIGYTFQTAWCMPTPIIKLIFNKFPDCNITYLAADDGGWIAFYQHKSDDGLIEIIDFSQNDQMKDVLLSALNTDY